MTENTSFDTIEDGADAFLKSWNADVSDKEAIRSNKEENRTDNSDIEAEDVHEDGPSEVETDEQDVSDDQTDNDAEQSEETEATVADDSHVVKVTVDGVEKNFKVSDLKRLAGQEVALNRRGEEIATQRKDLDSNAAKTMAATEALINRAIERYKPYENIDWAQAAATLDPEDYKSLKQVATSAYQDLQFLSTGLNEHIEQQKTARTAELTTVAKATIAELSDPKTGIPGFNETLYKEMKSFAIGAGIPEETMNTMVYGAPLRLIHKAMLWDKQQAAKASTSKVVKTPTQVIKSRVNADTSRKVSSSKTASDQSMNRLRKTGSVDDAADAFLSRWQRDDD